MYLKTMRLVLGIFVTNVCIVLAFHETCETDKEPGKVPCDVLWETYCLTQENKVMGPHICLEHQDCDCEQSCCYGFTCLLTCIEEENYTSFLTSPEFDAKVNDTPTGDIWDPVSIPITSLESTLEPEKTVQESAKGDVYANSLEPFLINSVTSADVSESRDFLSTSPEETAIKSSDHGGDIALFKGDSLTDKVNVKQGHVEIAELNWLDSTSSKEEIEKSKEQLHNAGSFRSRSLTHSDDVKRGAMDFDESGLDDFRTPSVALASSLSLTSPAVATEPVTSKGILESFQVNGVTVTVGFESHDVESSESDDDDDYKNFDSIPTLPEGTIVKSENSSVDVNLNITENSKIDDLEIEDFNLDDFGSFESDITSPKEATSLSSKRKRTKHKHKKCKANSKSSESHKAIDETRAIKDSSSSDNSMNVLLNRIFNRFKRKAEPGFPWTFWKEVLSTISKINLGREDHIYGSLINLSKFKPIPATRRDNDIKPHVIVTIAGLARLKFPCIILPSLPRSVFNTNTRSEISGFWKRISTGLYKLGMEKESLKKGYWPAILETNDQKRPELDAVFKRFVNPTLDNIRKEQDPGAKERVNGTTTWQRLTNRVFDHVIPLTYAEEPKRGMEDDMDRIVRQSPIGVEPPFNDNDHARVALIKNLVNDMDKQCNAELLKSKSRPIKVNTAGISKRELEIWEGMTNYTRSDLKGSNPCFDTAVFEFRTEVRFMHALYCRWAKEYKNRREKCKNVVSQLIPGNETELCVDLLDPSNEICARDHGPETQKCHDAKCSIISIYKDLKESGKDSRCDHYLEKIVSTFRKMRQNNVPIMSLPAVEARIGHMKHCHWKEHHVRTHAEKEFTGIPMSGLDKPSELEIQKQTFPNELDYNDPEPGATNEPICDVLLKSVVWKHKILKRNKLENPTFKKIKEEIDSIPRCRWSDVFLNGFISRDFGEVGKPLSERCKAYRDKIVPTFKKLQRKHEAIMSPKKILDRLHSMKYCDWDVKELEKYTKEPFDGLPQKDFKIASIEEEKPLRFPVAMDKTDPQPGNTNEPVCDVLLNTVRWKYLRLQSSKIEQPTLEQIKEEILRLPDCGWTNIFLEDYIRKKILVAAPHKQDIDPKCKLYLKNIVPTFKTLNKHKTAVYLPDFVFARAQLMKYCDWIKKNLKEFIDTTMEGVTNKGLGPLSSKEETRQRFPINLKYKEDLLHSHKTTLEDFPDQNIPQVSDLCNMVLKSIAWKYRRLQDHDLYVANKESFKEIKKEILGVPGCNWPTKETVQNYINEIILKPQNIIMEALNPLCYKKLQGYTWGNVLPKLTRGEIEELSNACRWDPNTVQNRVDFHFKTYQTHQMKSDGKRETVPPSDKKCKKDLKNVFLKHSRMSHSGDQLTKEEVQLLAQACWWSDRETSDRFKIVSKYHDRHFNGTRKQIPASKLNPYLILGSQCQSAVDQVSSRVMTEDNDKLRLDESEELAKECNWREDDVKKKFMAVYKFQGNLDPETEAVPAPSPYSALPSGCEDEVFKVFLKKRTVLSFDELNELATSCNWSSNDVSNEYKKLARRIYSK